MDNKLVVFVHIPKTAGSTLRAIMRWQYKPEQIFHINWDFDRNAPFTEFINLPEQKRKETRIVYGHIPFGLHEVVQREVDYFTMLRDPIERSISHYYHIRKLPNHFHHHSAHTMELGEFVDSGVFREMDNGQVRQLTALGQIPFGTCTPDMLDQAIANLDDRFCVVGLQERFDESILLLRRSLGWRKPPLYRRQNTGQRSKSESFTRRNFGSGGTPQ